MSSDDCSPRRGCLGGRSSIEKNAQINSLTHYDKKRHYDPVLIGRSEVVFLRGQAVVIIVVVVVTITGAAGQTIDRSVGRASERTR